MHTNNPDPNVKSMTVFVIFLALIAMTACGVGSSTENTAGGGPPTLDEVANATYSGVFDQPVTLTNGRWEGEPFVDGGASRPSAGLVADFVLVGDIDGDGLDEATVLLWEHSGGSGTRSYLAVMGRSSGALVNLGTDLVGDRVQVRSGFILDGRISLDLVQAGPADAACCPSQKAIVEWQLTDGKLAKVATATTGTLSLADLQGPEWVLAEIGWDNPVPADPEITIYFDGERVSGSGGCNRYFGTVTGGNPGRLEFSAMGTTMMACPEPSMDLERRYLRALASGSSYSFSAGRLVIGSETNDDFLALVFRQKETPSPTDDGH